jgi:protein involved in polysaccharide export with SLBB domain|tara:strand:- start:5603 stop:6649 length:1047 start_codon:yes stop_codon:yes gene_type:complete
MNIMKIRSLIFLKISICFVFGQVDEIDKLKRSTGSTQPVYQDLSLPSIPLEHEIDPKEYLLGPGDQLHIVVTSMENKLLPGQEFDLFNAETIEYYSLIGPAGELTLPSIGQFQTTGKSYSQIKEEIEQTAITRSYKKVQVTVRLAALRSFKIKILGGVESPGIITVSSVSRVMDAIRSSKGVQKYGNNEIVYLERNGERLELRLKEFLLNGDENQNPLLQEGDMIFIPFFDSNEEEKENFTEYKTQQVIVHGYVRRPRGFSYIPGYRASDYIAMVGGALNIGSENNTLIYRADGSEVHDAFDEFVEPGDVVFVPESLRSRLFGDISILQTATAIATLYLTYKAAISGS